MLAKPVEIISTEVCPKMGFVTRDKSIRDGVEVLSELTIFSSRFLKET